MHRFARKSILITQSTVYARFRFKWGWRKGGIREVPLDIWIEIGSFVDSLLVVNQACLRRRKFIVHIFEWGKGKGGGGWGSDSSCTEYAT